MRPVLRLECVQQLERGTAVNRQLDTGKIPNRVKAGRGSRGRCDCMHISTLE
jgi:hypothetical protein